MAVVIFTAVAYDAVTLTKQHSTAGVLHQTTGHLERTRRTLAATESKDTSTAMTRDARVAAQVRTVAQDNTVKGSLSTAMQTASTQNLDIATIHSCLAGVTRALDAVKSSDLQGAVNSITASSSACATLDGSNGGLSYPFDFPDPYVLTVGSEYYAYATNSVAGNIQIIRSTDLTNWTTLGDALPHLAIWAQPGATWAPSVIQLGANYVMYYSAIFGSTGDQCISAAVSASPEGPFIDSSTWPLECQLDRGGSIDPGPFVDSDGTPYLTWKSQGVKGQPPMLWSQQLMPTGTAIAPVTVPAELLAPTQSWQGGIIEGPDMVVIDGEHLLFYSANDWTTANYAIGDASCAGPVGPCTPEGTQPLVASTQYFSGPGGPSLFTDTSGNLSLAFAAWLPGKVEFPNSRVLFIKRLALPGGVPALAP
jgi:beta-xylosidase